jgi:DNA-binding transcriptional LysR family regulator
MRIAGGFLRIECLRNGMLVRVLPEYHTHSRDVYAASSSRQFVDAKIRRFVDTLRAHAAGELNAFDRARYRNG